MTTPDVPLRMEITCELPGTPEQIWDAIATAHGITSWFLPTDVEERERREIRTFGSDDVLVHLTGPVPGYIGFAAYDEFTEGGETTAFVQAH